MYCDHCGSPVADNAVVCPNCNRTVTPLPSLNMSPAPAQPPEAPPVAPFWVQQSVQPSEAPPVFPLWAQDAPPISAPTPPESGNLPPSQGNGQPPTQAPTAPSRYRLGGILEQGDGWTRYQATDERRCQMCHFERDADSSGEWCDNCGSAWNPAACELVQGQTLAPPEEVTGDLVFIEGQSYLLQSTAPPPLDTAALSLPNAPPLPPERLPASEDAGSREKTAKLTESGRLRYLNVGQASDNGHWRQQDEDSVFCLVSTCITSGQSAPVAGLFVVADGVGGAEAGEIASRLTIETIADNVLRNVWFDIVRGSVPEESFLLRVLIQAAQDANSRVLEEQRQRQKELQSTLTLALVVNTTAYVLNVGDSRTYLWRDGALLALTADHSVVGKLVAEGQIHPEDVYTHPNRNIITRCVGDDAHPLLESDTFVQPLLPGDRLVLCCDGLWEMVRDPQIAAVVGSHSAQEACDQLIDLANANGGDDNISVVVVLAGE